MEKLLSTFVSTRKADAAGPVSAVARRRTAMDLDTLTQRLEEPEQAEAKAVEVQAAAGPKKWRRVTDLDLLSLRMEEADDEIDGVVESAPDSVQWQPKTLRRQRPSSLPDLDDFSRLMEMPEETADAPADDGPEEEEHDKRPLRVSNEAKEVSRRRAPLRTLGLRCSSPRLNLAPPACCSLSSSLILSCSPPLQEEEERATPVETSAEAADKEEKGNIVPVPPRHAKLFQRTAAPAPETADLAAPAVEPSPAQSAGN